MAAAVFLAVSFALLGIQEATATAGFIQAPLSQEGLVGGSVALHCEAVGRPVPEIQWWFEGNSPNDTAYQLWDGAWLDRVHIHATYDQHAASSLSIDKLSAEDAGTYECRANNDPNRNHLTLTPRVRWVRAQASVVVLKPGTIETFVENYNSKIRLTCTLNQSSIEIVGHRWMRGNKVVKEDTLSGLTTEFEVDKEETGMGNYFCVFLPEPTGKGEFILLPPNVTAVKKSTHGEEGTTITIMCKASSNLPLLYWTWHKVVDSDSEIIVSDKKKFFVNSTGLETRLTIYNLDPSTDPGSYLCNGTNSEGSGWETITLRVHSHLAALWPFLGIVAEVLVLLIIIFICEKRQKSSHDADADEDELGSAPLKSSGHSLDKDKNVRQRSTS
ncbi:PREDICTED: basigin [Dipodomys ordii]|uniref:Basigin n=1 Tax=Dipodomys ordii TaxID=10020 RepID=A0A1S3FP15_DIPOR|nr:PREDICTED: basigin [Dipodomys ordii]